MNDITRINTPVFVSPAVLPARPSAPAEVVAKDHFVASGEGMLVVRSDPSPSKSVAPPLQTPPSAAAESTPVPTSLIQDSPHSPGDDGPHLPFLPPGDLGGGFPTARAGSKSVAEHLHNWISGDPTGAYDKGVSMLLHRVSGTTERSVGVDVNGLLQVEQTMFKALATGGDGYTSSAPPLFQALADGQAAYVNLGKKRQEEADHFMRMFSGLPLDVIEGLGAPADDLGKVREFLLNKAKNKEFPVYVDTDGKYDTVTPTESILTESIASIARRENELGSDFPDPRMYYKWLVTRVDSNYHRLDPWLFGARKETHDKIKDIKQELTPPWVKDDNVSDPFGAVPMRKHIQKAYNGMMDICGNGQPPTWDTLTDVADAVVNMDRDLLSGIQTYWIKLLRESSAEQRQSLMAPVARAWVNLNVLAPTDPNFDRVSPPNSPYIELVDRKTGEIKKERYDRSLALSQGVDHMIAGLGIDERREFLEVLMGEIRQHQPALEAREERLRATLGDSYRGLNVDAILNHGQNIYNPEVKAALGELKAATRPELSSHEMTPEYAEICRHRDMLDWVATRYSRYGDMAFNNMLSENRADEYATNPLILGEYYEPPTVQGGPSTPLPPGPTHQIVMGNPIEGKDPVKISVVLEGGGGKGFAFVETLRQLRESLSAGQGQVAIDEFAGNSAGALTAGLLAAGYDGDELSKVLQELDFKKFYSDYLWLSGGVDPKVRGINRTGLFSQQKMYKVIARLIQDKCHVEGRPVLFRDLPFKLKVTSTMLNANIPEDIRKKIQQQPDGQCVFSTETTPNMDVAAALCCSSAVPGFFNAPQLQVCTGSDGQKPVLHRMQMVDGGVVNNFPVGEISREDKSFLLTVPSYFEAPSATPGGEPITLSTLNFDSANIGAINEYNKTRFKQFGGHLMDTIQSAASEGYQRAVVALNLTDLVDQTDPVVQGRSRSETNHLLDKAHKAGLPTMTADAGAALIKSNLQGKDKTFVEQSLLNTLLDKNDNFKPGLFHDPRYTPKTVEAEGIGDMLAGVMAASMTAPSQIKHRLFEVL